jgi:phosphoglycolate phosphatase-like HAD superfamily hydrolase
MKFEAVLFDLDGTLLDSIEDLTDSMNIVLDGFGFPGHDFPKTGVMRPRLLSAPLRCVRSIANAGR